MKKITETSYDQNLSSQLKENVDYVKRSTAN